MARRGAAADEHDLPADFTTRYLDPTELYGRFKELAAEYPNISELITLPNKINGYQRRAQALMSGNFGTGVTPNTRLGQESAVVLTSRAWGHEGGNDITAEFRNPGVPSSPLTVSMVSNDLVVLLGTNAAGQVSSTAAPAGEVGCRRRTGLEPAADERGVLRARMRRRRKWRDSRGSA